jgi:hypothetical protein
LSSSQPEARDEPLAGGDVVLDVVFEAGLFHLELVNLGRRPALNVSCRFEKPLTGVDGAIVTQLPLFENVSFLMPGKRIRTLLDSSAAYFARGEPTTITASVSYDDRNGRRHKTTIEHDLEIYRDLVYVSGVGRASSRGAAAAEI